MFCARLFICALWSPAGKGLTSWLSFVVSTVSLSLSHWYPGSGVVLNCIDSWSLHPYLLCGHLLGKADLLALVSGVFLSLSHWFPGSGVVLDCMDFWSLHPCLLCSWFISENFCMDWMIHHPQSTLHRLIPGKDQHTSTSISSTLHLQIVSSTASPRGQSHSGTD